MKNKLLSAFMLLGSIAALYGHDAPMQAAALDTPEIIADMKRVLPNDEFFRLHSERNLADFLNFLKDPLLCFADVQNIQDLSPYFEFYESYLAIKTGYRRFVTSDFLQKHFNVLDNSKISVLTFLMMHTDGIHSQIFCDQYTRLFGSQSRLFIKYLITRADWKAIVDSLGAGDLVVFKRGIQDLGNSRFENEFRSYASEKWDLEQLPSIVRENTVIFIACRDEDGGKDSAHNQGTTKVLADFRRSTRKLTQELNKVGLTVERASSKDVWFQLPNATLSKFWLDAESCLGMGLFSSTKPPILISKFPPRFSEMARIISEYFELDIRAGKLYRRGGAGRLSD